MSNLQKLNFEINRKLFHLCSLVIPISYLMLDKLYMLVVLSIVTAIILYMDTSRYYNSKIKDLAEHFFVKIMRDSEKSGTLALSGMSNLFLGSLLVVLIFPKGLAITAMLVLVFSDSAAAIVGRKIGNPLPNGKSYEGAAAFATSCFLVSFLSSFFIGFGSSFMTIILVSLITAAVEFYSDKTKFNDNLTIPLCYAISTVIFNFIL